MRREREISFYDLEGSVEQAINLLSYYPKDANLEIRKERVRSSHIDGGAEEELQLWVTWSE